ncbi:hypothetical protein EJ02DRAFT_454890 [Clathrospora elynae]|uniref:Uncharacterized protein n=1 Tax=Clathrospora elynae TaxID=706981 RepID=A0A6A5SNN4_9PLEO|nr:hypothetical protein EJ02DRAFT_454890 [Clathrospora elynae]
MSALTLHKMAIAPVVNGLKNAHSYITKGYEHAQAQSIDPNDFISASIHPDMKGFSYQVQRFTDAAKFIPSRVNPSLESITLPDTEQTFPELLERIEKTIKYLEGFKEKDFEGQEGHEVVIKLRNNTLQIKLSAMDYVAQYGHPNFWFHVTTAYDILRMKGVDVGKIDFLNGAKGIEVMPVPKED